MKKVSMIITDLDFSLLDNAGKISTHTKSVFKKCKEAGIIIVFATARPYRNTRIFYDSIEPDALICHAGGAVYVNNEIIWSNGINPIEGQNVLRNIACDYPNIGIGVESENSIYSNFDVSKYWKIESYKNLDLERFPLEILYKLIIELKQINNRDRIKKYLSSDLYFNAFEGNVGLIMNKNNTKWNGITKLLEYYNIRKENIISFGDSDVDVEMIEKSGIGIAMENGNEEIRSKAKYICESNNNDGIAKWINENMSLP